MHHDENTPCLDTTGGGLKLCNFNYFQYNLIILAFLLDEPIYVLIIVVVIMCPFAVTKIWLISHGFTAIADSNTHVGLYLIRLAIPMEKVTWPELLSSPCGTTTATEFHVDHPHFSQIPTMGPFNLFISLSFIRIRDPSCWFRCRPMLQA